MNLYTAYFKTNINAPKNKSIVDQEISRQQNNESVEVTVILFPAQTTETVFTVEGPKLKFLSVLMQK
jgi:hypothetical protein